MGWQGGIEAISRLISFGFNFNVIKTYQNISSERIVRLGASSELGDTTTYLIGKGASTKITKGELESAVATLNVDFESDKSVGISC